MAITDPAHLGAGPIPEDSRISLHSSSEARQRTRKRNAADNRMRLYGLLAIGFAAFALVALLYNVFIRAASVLNEHYIEVKVDIEEGEDDFLTLSKSTMRAAFPEVSGRSQRRELYDLISDGASDDMRNEAQAGTLEHGTGVSRDFLVSDTVDLYLRGNFGSLEKKPHTGALTGTVDGKKLLLSSDADDFGLALSFVKATLIDEVASLEQQAARQSTGIAVLRERLDDLTGPEREETVSQIEGFKVKRDQFLAQAANLDTIIASDGSEELKLTARMPSFFVRTGDGMFKLTQVSNRTAVGTMVSQASDFSGVPSADWQLLMMETPEAGRTVSDLQIALVEQLRDEGRVISKPNWRFFETGDATQPEIAGIKGAVVGSLWTMLVTFSLAFPIGVLAAIYLEEFAAKNRVTDFVEVNINNLAAVPSIVFGLLGLAVFLNFFGVPRSSPLAGGLVLALMTLPTVIIASRAAIRAVPPSIRTAALGLGASKVQTVFHHVLPLAMPGILTGTIIGMAQALGETAPLLMIGMVAFITAIPDGITDSATVLPVQVFQWANGSERAFDIRTAAAIVVLLCFLVVMNAIAIFLRKRFERRW